MAEYFLYSYEFRILKTWEDLLEGFLHLTLPEIKAAFNKKGVVGGVPAPRAYARERRAYHTTAWDMTEEQYDEVLIDLVGGREDLVGPSWFAVRNLFWRGENAEVIIATASGYKGTYRAWKAQQEPEKTIWDKIGEVIEDAGDFLKDNLALVVIYLIIVMMFLIAPTMMISGVETIMSVLEAIGLATSKTLTVINNTIAAVKGWFHIQEIGEIMRTLGSVSRLLERISPTWRANVIHWENQIAKASKDLFGDSSTISGYLAVVQMAVWDLSSLTGDSYDLYQVEFYGEAKKFTDRIAANTKRYQNAPGELYYDLQEWFLKPLYGEGVEKRRASDELIAGVALTADALQKNLKALDNRLVEYEKVMKPLALDSLKRDIAQVRSTLHEDAIRPLADFKKDVTDIYLGKLPGKAFSERWQMLVQPALDNANILGADEATLSDYQKAQRLRKGENLLEFVSRTARTAWDSFLGGVHRLYTETIGKLDRGDTVSIEPVPFVVPEKAKLETDLTYAPLPLPSPKPPKIAMWPYKQIEKQLTPLDMGITNAKEVTK